MDRFVMIMLVACNLLYLLVGYYIGKNAEKAQSGTKESKNITQGTYNQTYNPVVDLPFMHHSAADEEAIVPKEDEE